MITDDEILTARKRRRRAVAAYDRAIARLGDEMRRYAAELIADLIVFGSKYEDEVSSTSVSMGFAKLP